MENPRAEKVAVVEEVKARLSSADAAILTEYRGLKVGDLSTLRRSLKESGGDYRIYKNTLVRFAVQELGLDGLDEHLTGPTAIAFVDGDAVGVAKALRDFARTNPNLIVKGGVLGDNVLSATDATALADIAPREVLLARFAGLLAAPMQQFAGLLQALPRNFAYGLKALIDLGGAPGAPADAVTPAATDETPAEDTGTEDTGTEDTGTEDTGTEDTGTGGATAADPTPEPLMADAPDLPDEAVSAPQTTEEAAATEVVDTLDHLAAAAAADGPPDSPTQPAPTEE